MKSKLIYPSLYEVKDFSTYLRQLFNLNKDRGIPISIGFFARRIGWTPSLVKSLLYGNRTLTFKRALEFSQFAGFGIWETERLCKLTDTFKDIPHHHTEFKQASIPCNESLRLLESAVEGAKGLSEESSESGQPGFCRSGSFKILPEELRILEGKMGDIQRCLQKFAAQNQESNEEKKSYYLDISIFNLSPEKAKTVTAATVPRAKVKAF